MYSLFDETESFAELNASSKTLLGQILAQLALKPDSTKLPASSNIYNLPAPDDSCFFLLREGHLFFEVDDQRIFAFDEGDLVGLERFGVASSGAQNLNSVSVKSEFAVIVDRYNLATFFKELSSNHKTLILWHDYLAMRFSLISMITASLSTAESVFTPAVKSFAPGEKIISQGACESEVYTLGEGRADVFVDSIKVGEIIPDEIFGAIAGLTGTPRTADVIATEPCLVLSLPSAKFIDLIKNRPATVKKLIDDMARKIVALNDKVVSADR